MTYEVKKQSDGLMKTNDLPLAEGILGNEEPTDEQLDEIAHTEPEQLLTEEYDQSKEPDGVDVGLGTNITITHQSPENEAKTTGNTSPVDYHAT